MGRILIRSIGPLFLISTAVWGQQYKADKAGPVPPEVPPGIAQALDNSGFRISNNGSAYCGIWFRNSLPPTSGTSSEQNVALPNVTLPNVTLPNIPVGSLLGVVRFDAMGSDRRGQAIHPGVYTLRYGIMPMNTAHEGAAPQRDFLLLIPAAEDRDLNAIPNFDTLVAMSRKASRTEHPAVLSLWKADSDSPGFSQQGDSDWVLQSKVGDTPIVVIVVGAASG